MHVSTGVVETHPKGGSMRVKKTIEFTQGQRIWVTNYGFKGKGKAHRPATVLGTEGDGTPFWRLVYKYDDGRRASVPMSQALGAKVSLTDPAARATATVEPLAKPTETARLEALISRLESICERLGC